MLQLIELDQRVASACHLCVLLCTVPAGEWGQACGAAELRFGMSGSGFRPLHDGGEWSYRRGAITVSAHSCDSGADSQCEPCETGRYMYYTVTD